jgi:hypothetical protein
MGNGMEAPQNTKNRLPYDSTISFLGIYTKECKSGYNKDTWTPMFKAALFTAAKLWKQPRCPTSDKWIEKVWYLYAMEFHSVMKKTTREHHLE